MKSEGACYSCDKVFSGSAIGKHLISCEERKKQKSSTVSGKIFHFRASDGPFLVHFEVDGSRNLGEIDSFLRDLWLECCGHLSMFTINGKTYVSNPKAEYDDKSMKVSIERILFPGVSFSYEYDFGSTTHLNLKCIETHSGSLKDVKILARNNLPDFECSCGKKPEEVCQECMANGEEFFLCKECKNSHECDKDMRVLVVNSPRIGVCGYTGE